MRDREYHSLRHLEDDHWWFQVQRGLALGEVKARASGREGLHLLDAGCGTGGLMNAMRNLGVAAAIHGVDSSPLAVQHARDRGLEHVTLASVGELPFDDKCFDGITCLDVLYHRDVDEDQAMREFHRVLRPGGFLVINLPAFDALRGSHDMAVGGQRRYRRSEVADLIRQHGLQVAKLHYWNAWQFLPVLCWRQISRRRVRGDDAEVRSDLRATHPGLSGLLGLLGHMDAHWCRVLRIPFGTSVFSVAQKPSPR